MKPPEYPDVKSVVLQRDGLLGSDLRDPVLQAALEQV